MKHATAFSMIKIAAALLLWLEGTAAAQTTLFPPDELARVQEGIRDIYNMEYKRAAENFQGMIKDAPDDPAGYAYLAMTYWVEELSGKQELSIDRFAASDFFVESPKYRPKVNPKVEARFRELSDQAVEKAQVRLKKEPGDRTALFLRGFAYQNVASFETSLKRSWWSAFRAGAKTFKDHRRLLREDPEFHEARLSIGVYDYVAGSLPWHIKVLAFLLGYHGDKERGKRQLEMATEKATLVADDARIVLILIYTREKNYEKALDYLSQLQKKYPQNYLVHLDMGGIALRMEQPDKAIGIYEDILRKREAGERKYAELERASLYNRLGVAWRDKGDLEKSADWFARALRESPLSALSQTVARLELGKTLDLMGKRDEALKNYEAVLAAEDFAGSRLEAEELLKRPFRG